MKLTDLPTPALILDRGRLKANIDRMNRHATELGVILRPHVKTAKCAPIAEMSVGPGGPVTVSTLKEAEYFVAHGFHDITYAVGITIEKLTPLAKLQDKGAEIKVMLDSREAAEALLHEAERLNSRFRVLIEIDCGAERGGLSPDDPEIINIARLLASSKHAGLAGVLTHAGHSYDSESLGEVRRIAEDERRAVVTAAAKIEAVGIACPVRSVGSTPTALFADNLEGVTEMRPGVYVFGDVFQSCLGTCKPEDIAVSVLATVIGHKHHRHGFALIDAGGLALSKDQNAANRFGHDIGYGLVYDLLGQQLQGNITLDTVNQEHGWLRPIKGDFPFARFPLTSKVRIMPNHSCMMAAPYDRYYIVEGGDEVVEIWEKTTGW
jgi:D-serine deaminase-like pyridoxal phosphate-dependent protein